MRIKRYLETLKNINKKTDIKKSIQKSALIAMDKNNYFIKKGYKSQKNNFTLSQKAQDLYWTNERIFFSKYFQYDVYKYAQKIVKKNNIKNVLDLGCGTGIKLMELIYPVCQDITGIDQRETILFCKKRYNVGDFIIDDLENPIKKLGIFDLIICADVIEHLLNPDKLLEYIKRVSHNNTFIIISTPERDILRGKNCMASNKLEHVREWNKEELLLYLVNRGFTIIDYKLSSFTGFSFDKRIIEIRKTIKKRTGTIKTNQLVSCKIKE
jgi:2-polyprenyl-3-methyl-5-hydroxy-6-metoxy-1,4-benzoquinol methylase